MFQRLTARALAQTVGGHFVRLPARQMSARSSVTIRQARSDDFPVMSRILINSGLVTESTDYLKFHTYVDPDSLCVAEIEENGISKVVGCAQGCAFTDDIGFLNLLAVDQDYRRKGIAKKLAEYRLARLGNRNLVSNIVPNGLANLKKFVTPIESFKVAFHMADATNFTVLESWRPPSEYHIVPHRKVSFDQMLWYDSSIHVVPRPKILRLLLDDPKGQCFVCLRDTVIVGLVRIYDGLFTEICLFADDKIIAKSLLAAVSPSIVNNGKQAIITSPLTNDDANELNKDLELNPALQMTRIYTKKLIDVPYKKIYGLSNVGYFLA